MRCWQCADATRFERGCTYGFRQGLGFEDRPANPVTCPVITQEPEGFWAANRIGKIIERGAPAITMRDITHSQLDLAEFVQFEISEGERAFEDRRTKANERLAAIIQGADK
jgi:hypothetical protein